jgi:hypothetical protein
MTTDDHYYCDTCNERLRPIEIAMGRCSHCVIVKGHPDDELVESDHGRSEFLGLPKV